MPAFGSERRQRLARPAHVSWFTLSRSETEAGIYYSVSKDGGKSFAPRPIIHANTAPETLYNNLVVGDDDTVYVAWSNLDGNNQAQIYMRTLAGDGRTWRPIQQISATQGNASRPTLALIKNQLQVAWTETDGGTARVVYRSATVGQSILRFERESQALAVAVAGAGRSSKTVPLQSRRWRRPLGPNMFIRSLQARRRWSAPPPSLSN